MTYKIITFTKLDGSLGTNIVRITDNEIVTLGLGEQDAEYVKWLENGNISQPWTEDE
jgi:hypothetical protein